MADPVRNKYEKAIMSGGYYREPTVNRKSSSPKNNVDQIKKPKMDEVGREAQAQNFEVAENDKASFQLEKTMDEGFVSSFIGLDSFESENVFLGLMEQELVLVHLGDAAQSQKANFCFKGKCSALLVYGQIEIAGHSLNNFSVLDGSNPNSRVKWLDLFSPETNSFLAILNSSKDRNANPALANLATIPHETQLAAIVDQINRALNLDQTNLAVQGDLKLFLNGFSLQSSSLIAIKPLKSPMCNYISSFDNLNHIYNARSKRNQSETLMSPYDRAMTQLGLTNVKSGNFNAVLVRSEEEKKIYDEVFQNDKKPANPAKQPIILCAGGKDVGKSTFLRNLINAYLSNNQKIAYLDCDPGQCEFTLGGCISLSLITQPLLGPPHTHVTHSSQEKRSYFLGHLSPSDVPGQYMQFIRQCHQDFQNLQASLNSHESLPLIVNTMGWNQGLGLCLLKEIILLVQPTHIIQINHPVEANKNMPTLSKDWLSKSDGWPSRRLRENAENNRKSNESFNRENSGNSSTMDIDDPEQKLIDKMNYKLLLIKSFAPFKSTKFQTQAPQKFFSPRDHRNVAIISYFARLHEDGVHFKPMHHLRPYRVPWSRLALHVCHIHVPYHDLLRALNASLVALCHVDPKYIRRVNNDNELPGYLEAYDRETKQNTIHSCIGFGMVRGIQMETKEFFILTPEPVELLNEVNLLVKGVPNAPAEFFYQQDSETPCPYMSFASGGGSGQNASSAHNNIGVAPVQRKYLIHQNQKLKS